MPVLRDDTKASGETAQGAGRGSSRGETDRSKPADPSEGAYGRELYGYKTKGAILY